MRNPFVDRVIVDPVTLIALRHDHVGWGHDPVNASLIMPRTPPQKGAQ